MKSNNKRGKRENKQTIFCEKVCLLGEYISVYMYVLGYIGSLLTNV